MHGTTTRPAMEKKSKTVSSVRRAFKGAPEVIIESLVKNTGEFRKEVAVLTPIMAKEESHTTIETAMKGRKAILVYGKEDSLPSFLIIRDILNFPPEIVVQTGDRKLLLTLGQTPEGENTRDVIREDLLMGGGKVRIMPIMMAMPIMRELSHVLKGNKEKKKGSLYPEMEAVLHGTDKKRTLASLMGSEISEVIVEKALMDMVSEAHKGFVPKRLKDRKFTFIIGKGEKVFLFTEGNQLNTIIDYVPALLALKPGRVVVTVDGKEYFGAQVSEKGVKDVYRALGITE